MEEPTYRVRADGCWLDWPHLSVRLIASQDVATRRWRIRAPAGVTVKPHVWRKVVGRALREYVRKNHPQDARPRRGA